MRKRQILLRHEVSITHTLVISSPKYGRALHVSKHNHCQSFIYFYQRWELLCKPLNSGSSMYGRAHLACLHTASITAPAARCYSTLKVLPKKKVVLFGADETTYSPYKPGGESEGKVKPGWEVLAERFRENFARGLERGAQLHVWKDGRTVVHVCGRGESGVPMARGSNYDAESLQAVYQAGSNVEVVAIALLVDRGLLDYDAKVADFWPEFAQNGKTNVTVSDVMRHRAGLPYLCNADGSFCKLSVADIKAQNKVDYAIEHSVFLTDTPGLNLLTRGMVVDGLVRRVDPTGRSVAELLKEEVIEPLEAQTEYSVGIPSPSSPVKIAQSCRLPDDFAKHMEIGPALLSRTHNGVAQLHKLKAEGSTARNSGLGVDWLFTESGDVNIQCPSKQAELCQLPLTSYNVFASARGLNKIIRIFTENGVVEGKQILSKAAVEDALSAPETQRCSLLDMPLTFTKGGLGVSDAFKKKGFEGYVGWGGWGGSMNWCHPERGIAVSYVATGMMNDVMGDLFTEHLYLFNCGNASKKPQHLNLVSSFFERIKPVAGQSRNTFDNASTGRYYEFEHIKITKLTNFSVCRQVLYTV
eukprot:g21799.t1